MPSSDYAHDDGRAEKRPVADWLAEWGCTQPDRIALMEGEMRWTFTELAAWAGTIVGRMSALGVARSDRVAVLAPPGAGHAALIHALRWLGAVLVPLNARGAPAELAAQVADAGVRALVHADASVDEARAIAQGAGGPLIVSLESLTRAIEGTEVPVAQPLDLSWPQAIVYTSGTTGRAKGAILTHANHLASAQAWAGLLAPQPMDRWLACLPFHHVAGLAMIMRSAIWGVPLVVHPSFEPRAVSRAIDDEAISHLSLVAVMLRRLIAERGDRHTPTSLRGVLLGGGPTPVELIRRALERGIPVIPTYGLTETASGVAALPPEEVGGHPGSSGRALDGVELRVGHEGTPCGPGEIGEILVRGPMVMAGYHARPDDSAAALAGGWLHTGDLGSIDRGGYLTIADRRADLIISGGENIYPAEIEAVLVEHPGVIDAGVFGQPDDRWGAVPVAAIVVAPSPTDPPDDPTLRAFCAARLARYKVPTRFVRVEAVPRSAAGKLLRRELAERAAPMLGWGQVRAVERAGARIQYRIGGSGPALVLLHGTLNTSADWARLVDRLRDRFTIVAPDRRGSGASRVADPLAVSAVDHLEDLAAILDAEGLATVVIAGHSYGGCIALDFAARFPERVRGVVAFEPPYGPLAPPESGPWFEQIGRVTGAAHLAAGSRAAGEAFMRGVMGSEAFEALPPQRRDTLLAEGDGAAADSTLLGLAPAMLPAISCPVTLAGGTRSDPRYRPILQRLAATIPNARILELAGAGHSAPITDPAEFATLIEQTIGAQGLPTSGNRKAVE